MAAGLIPKFSSILTTIPYCVLGGATIFCICINCNDRYEADYNRADGFPQYNSCWIAVAVGMGVTQASASLAQFPDWVTTIFGKSPVVLATIVAIVLNLTLPKAKK